MIKKLITKIRILKNFNYMTQKIQQNHVLDKKKQQI